MFDWHIVVLMPMVLEAIATLKNSMSVFYKKGSLVPMNNEDL